MDNAKAVDNAFSLGSTPVNNAEEVFVTYLGEIEEMGRTRTILGPYVLDYRGFKEDSPCWSWQGPLHQRPPLLEDPLEQP